MLYLLVIREIIRCTNRLFEDYAPDSLLISIKNLVIIEKEKQVGQIQDSKYPGLISPAFIVSQSTK